MGPPAPLTNCAYASASRGSGPPHATVRLNFFRVTRWQGEPQPKEDQAIAWQRLGGELVSPMLPANAPVLASLALPVEYAVTDATRWGAGAMLERLERRLRQGLKLLQVREPSLLDRSAPTPVTLSATPLSF